MTQTPQNEVVARFGLKGDYYTFFVGLPTRDYLRARQFRAPTYSRINHPDNTIVMHFGDAPCDAYAASKSQSLSSKMGSNRPRGMKALLAQRTPRPMILYILLFVTLLTTLSCQTNWRFTVSHEHDHRYALCRVKKAALEPESTCSKRCRQHRTYQSKVIAQVPQRPQL